MEPSFPDTGDAVAGLLKQAAATLYCRPALRELGAALPDDDSLLVTALDAAAGRRDAKAFSHLYLAALLAGRRIPAGVLAMGAPLLPEAPLIMQTSPRLEGDVASALAVAIRSGRMGTERDAISLVTGWLYYERLGLPVSEDFRILSRKVCRTASRTGGALVLPLLRGTAALSGDARIPSILRANSNDARSFEFLLKDLRKSQSGKVWENLLPAHPVGETLIGDGATVKRAIPKAGRNDPCPCGSGKKFKQCCAGKITTSEAYQVEGVTLSHAAAHPELLLTPLRIREMRSYELYQLDPARLSPLLAGQVATRLVTFGEIPRAIEVLKAIGPDAASPDALDEIAFDLCQARDANSLRWLVDWAPGKVFLSSEMEILIAEPAARLACLQEKAREAIEAERGGNGGHHVLLAELGYAALVADPALGLLIARGALLACNEFEQATLFESMEDARDLLGLDGEDPAAAMLDAGDQSLIDQERHARDLEKIRAENASRVSQRDAEIEKLKSHIGSMQHTLAQHEKAAQQARPKTTEPAVTPAAESAETRELRETLRRLKDNLKVEHEERNRAMRDLRATREQLRRNTRQQAEATAGSEPPAPEESSTEAIRIDWETQTPRIPEYSPAFRDAIRKHPAQAAAAAITAAGRLAAGDPSIWKTARALKLRPGTLRVRIAGDYRLLFETGPADTLRIIDLILRRDLDRWLTAAAR